MRKKQIQLLAVVASSLMAFSASAAEPCKAYVKIDMGYGLSYNAHASGTGVDGKGGAETTSIDNPLFKNQRGMIGSASVGYAFNDAMRSEVSLNFNPKMKSEMVNFAIETREIGGSAKILYDFNNTTSVTPFLFGGLGASSVKPTIKVANNGTAPAAGSIRVLTVLGADDNNPTGPASTSVDMKAKTVMTYQGGFGLAFKLSDMMNVDLTYGVGSKNAYVAMSNIGSGIIAQAEGSVTTPTFTNREAVKEIKIKKQMDQSLSLGFRFTM